MTSSMDHFISCFQCEIWQLQDLPPFLVFFLQGREEQQE